MLYATNRFPGDGLTTQYEISFVGGYLDRTHVKAYIEDAALVQTPVTLTSGNFLGPFTIAGIAPIPVGSTLVIYRDTPKAPIVDFVNGSRMTEANLDTASRQGSFIAAEGADAVSPAGLAGVIQQVSDFSAAAGVARDEAVAAQGAVIAAADAASLSASNAGDSELSAAASASSALTNKNLSDTAAAAAAASASQALGYRNTAQTAATDASASASQAATSASTAVGAQAAVALSASNAAASASAAAATAAEVAANTADALASKNAAAASALSAATSATQASNSATAAAGSATSAATARDSAISSATNAGTSASTASTQAGIATTKAAEAATSATNAGASESAAASYAASINPADLVHRSGTETITGAKTFTGAVVVPTNGDPSAVPTRPVNYDAAKSGLILNAWPSTPGVTNNVVYAGWHSADGRLIAKVDTVELGTLQTSLTMASGKVGAHMFAHFNTAGVTRGYGDQVSGGELRPASPVLHQGTPMTGIWVCLGYCVGSTDATIPGAKTLFMRIS